MAWYPDYPTSWAWTPVEDLVDDVLADHINQAYKEIEAIGTDLISHKGSFDNHSARHEDTGADEISLAGLQGESAELVSHKSDNMPHQFVDGGTTYKYGFKQENSHVVFMYEEVL